MNLTYRMVSIFSVPLSSLTKQEFQSDCGRLLQEGTQVSVATVNPEILLLAKKNPRFVRTLSSCSFRVVDGFGISLAMYCKYHVHLSRITGSDAVEALIRIARERKFSVGLIGGKKGRSTRAVQTLHTRYPDVQFVDVLNGEDCIVDKDGKFIHGEQTFARGMVLHKPNVLFVAFGAQKQESFLLQLFERYSFLRAAIGVGGLVDVWSGDIKRSPRIFSRLGLEWLWRLFQEPKRFTRIVNAVIVFPIQAIFFDRRQ